MNVEKSLRTSRRITSTFLLCSVFSASLCADGPENHAFLQDHCVHCHDSVRSLHFSPDSQLLASASGYDFINGEGVEGTDYTLRVWDVEKGAEIIRQPLAQTGQCVRFHPEGKRLVSASGGVGQTAGMRLWQLPESVWPEPASVDEVSRQEGHSDSIRDLQPMKNNERFGLVGIPGGRFAFSADVTVEQIVRIVESIDNGQRFWFYDEHYDSASDPGAFVTLVRVEGKLWATWNNHGWSTPWIRLTDKLASDYVRACRNENMLGARNAINYVGMERGKPRRLPTDERIAEGAEAKRLLEHVQAVVDVASSQDQGE